MAPPTRSTIRTKPDRTKVSKLRLLGVLIGAICFTSAQLNCSPRSLEFAVGLGAQESRERIKVFLRRLALLHSLLTTKRSSGIKTATFFRITVHPNHNHESQPHNWLSLTRSRTVPRVPAKSGSLGERTLGMSKPRSLSWNGRASGMRLPAEGPDPSALFP